MKTVCEMIKEERMLEELSNPRLDSTHSFPGWSSPDPPAHPLGAAGADLLLARAWLLRFPRTHTSHCQVCDMFFDGALLRASRLQSPCTALFNSIAIKRYLQLPC